MYLLALGFEHTKVEDSEGMLRRLREDNGRVQVQLVKPSRIAGLEHLKFAAHNAIQSFNGKGRRSKSLAVELLLYAACQRQISKAISILGVDGTDTRVVLLGLSDSKEALEQLSGDASSMFGGKSDDRLLDIDSRQKLAELKRCYAVSVREMDGARISGENDADVLKRLIVERSALLVTRG